jgi:hypothetical protein
MGARRKRGIDGEVGGILVLKMILQSRGRERQLRISAHYCRFGKPWNGEADVDSCVSEFALSRFFCLLD